MHYSLTYTWWKILHLDKKEKKTKEKKKKKKKTTTKKTWNKVERSDTIMSSSVKVNLTADTKVLILFTVELLSKI